MTISDYVITFIGKTSFVEYSCNQRL